MHAEIVVYITYILTNPGTIGNDINRFELREPVENIYPVDQHVTDLVAVHPVPVEMSADHIFHIGPFRTTNDILVTSCMIIGVSRYNRTDKSFLYLLVRGDKRPVEMVLRTGQDVDTCVRRLSCRSYERTVTCRIDGCRFFNEYMFSLFNRIFHVLGMKAVGRCDQHKVDR